MTLRTLLAALVALASLATACESSEEGPGTSPFTCVDGKSNFQPCGGNPEGEWVFDAACFDFQGQWDGNEMMAACPAAKVSGQMTWTGSAAFADGQLTMALTGGMASTHLEIPTTCLLGKACEGVVPEFTCAAAGETCVCDQQSAIAPQPTDTMAYQVDGTELVIGAGTADETRTSFCVKGDWALVEMRIGSDAGAGMPVHLSMKRK